MSQMSEPLPRTAEMTPKKSRAVVDPKRITILRALRPLLLCLLLPLTYLLVRYAAGNPAWVETRFSQGVYPAVSWFLSLLTSWFPFSLAEFLVYGFALFALTYFFFLVWRAVLYPQRLLRLLRSVARILAFTAVAYCFFEVAWGLNYYRQSFGEIAGYETRPSSTEELEALAMDVLENAAALRGGMQEDNRGVMRLSDVDGMLNWVPEGYFSARLPGLSVSPSGVKKVAFSRGLSILQVAGIFIPFTFESNINMEQPDCRKPMNACHEGAHLRGIAREDEASFVAYLVCMKSQNAEYQYSASLFALSECLNALAGADMEAARAVRAQMPEGVLRDLSASHAFWVQFEGKASDVQTTLNDAYLRTNGQSDGVHSYGRVVDLLLAMRRKMMAGAIA